MRRKNNGEGSGGENNKQFVSFIHLAQRRRETLDQMLAVFCKAIAPCQPAWRTLLCTAVAGVATRQICCIIYVSFADALNMCACVSVRVGAALKQSQTVA